MTVRDDFEVLADPTISPWIRFFAGRERCKQLGLEKPLVDQFNACGPDQAIPLMIELLKAPQAKEKVAALNAAWRQAA